MLPVLQGRIARRILLNFRADPGITARLLPAPLVPEVQNGAAIVGICLIRLEEIRPRGVPAAVGLSSENMAHRVAIRYPAEQGQEPGVFIWRRDTDQRLMELLGGRLFPGVHGHATYEVTEAGDDLAMRVRTPGGEADVAFRARPSDWKPTASFADF